MTVVPLVNGVGITILAVVMVTAWLAIGSLVVRRDDPDSGANAAVALLAGSGVISFCLAVMARAGMVTAAVLIWAVASVLILLARRSHVQQLLKSIVPLAAKTFHTPVTRIAVAITAAIVWIIAISPPRSGDAMRYHLAHIAQIAREGKWAGIADYHYALPFGWSLGYLPFQTIGHPEGAQLLSFLLLLILASSLLLALDKAGASPVARLAAILLLFHPFIVRTFGDANADPYSLVVMSAVSALVMRIRELTRREAALLGFAAWIGAGSRYQLVAAGIVVTVMILASALRRETRRHVIAWFAAGALAALVLASPFYLANLADFGNPVWPLFVGPASASSTYKDAVAASYSAMLNGQHDVRTYLYAAKRLLTSGLLFPLPHVILAVTAGSFFTRDPRIRRLGAFNALFFVLWIVMQPSLYPRFIVLLLPATVLGLGLMVERWIGGMQSREKLIRRTAAAASMLLSLAAIAVSWDNVRYAVTGDANDYHRFTWFYPVYEWVNAHTPVDARMLVMVSSGHSYYLDRPYRRADPWLSGVVNWPAINGATGLASALDSGSYRYVIYEDRDWSVFPGGSQMMRAIRDGMQSGELVPVREFHEKLYTSRVSREFSPTRVLILKRGRAPSDAH